MSYSRKSSVYFSKSCSDFCIDYELEIKEVFIYIETNWATDTLPRQQFMVDEFRGLEIILQEVEQWREEVLDKISEARTSNLTISVRSGSTTPVYEGELTLEVYIYIYSGR